MSRKVQHGAVAVVLVLGALALSAGPAFADTDDTTAWHEVRVNTTSEMVFTGSQTDQITLAPTATGNADSAAGGALGVRSNVAWKVQWQAVTGARDAESTTAAGGTSLTASGFGAAVAGSTITYQGTNAVANGANVWSAQIATTGTNQSLPGTFSPLATTASTVWSGTATSNAAMTPTYSADVDATLTHATGGYYGTIYYKLSTN